VGAFDDLAASEHSRTGQFTACNLPPQPKSQIVRAVEANAWYAHGRDAKRQEHLHRRAFGTDPGMHVYVDESGSDVPPRQIMDNDAARVLILSDTPDAGNLLTTENHSGVGDWWTAGPVEQSRPFKNR
jgi:hypothetical protein